ncbi:hypothetical protein R3P38DRAFT_2639092 [Favolaschia claudopus]|uniref:CxC5 like cysteine cluster associated with KDZ domain-containing protein n=1 Tax=Favolaschia claudopus TaxID=2862362 RepID=A0AAW0AJP7_9AGAR
MATTVRELILILQIYFPPELSLYKALQILGLLIALYPIHRLHLNQQRQPHQPRHTAWLTGISAILLATFRRDDSHAPTWASGTDRSEEFTAHISEDLIGFYSLLGLNPRDLEAPSPRSFFPPARPVLCTSRTSCVFCPPADLNIVPTLRRREKFQTVWLLDNSFNWVQAGLLVAHCASCRADYFPDRITYKDETNRRRQKLEVDCQYIRVSKQGTWVHRRIALFQENALNRFHAGWSNFADWLNASTQSKRQLTYRQSQRLFIEHFSRRLLVFTGKADSFTCAAHPSTRLLVQAVREVVGVNGGSFETAMDHGCTECTHVKRYRDDLVDEGFVSGAGHGVVGLGAGNVGDVSDHRHSSPALNKSNGRYLELLAGMFKCALDVCEGPLVNYKDGRFCQAHLNMTNICGIIPCGRAVRSPGSLTCDIQSHVDWHREYENRFSRLSFAGVQRVLRRQQENDGEGNPELQVELPVLGNTPGNEVVHTFRAKNTYCLQTVQWACGYPIGWGKCYRSESLPQVLQILENIWADYPDSKPGFIAYDNACSLLRHIVTQDPNSHWLASTKLIVDAWHYITHRATDLLCHAHGNSHSTRAFNTETAEQLNSWLSGFEPQLRQMSDVNYDFFIHVVMMLYGERVNARIAKKNLELSDEFWAAAGRD